MLAPSLLFKHAVPARTQSVSDDSREMRLISFAKNASKYNFLF
ncbi:MAG: hypothetical protein NVS3B5_15880 [Sphingomicrobium sp.]